ncbi:hypothetical protein PCANC_23505 [Puccinia coronata f. sp. avenae]|uniref:hAT-like transposase RNase-H fold domain-containing protein n=1 Tax=Puccinia coronata f. sp. avenae TaxID=200324 RepID=A0A2N5TPL9_9BASI|nr:hypothetical protein PCANC_23505 [Puccinia coronata f. sp. avenae]
MLGYVPELLPIAEESEETADPKESNVFESNDKGPLDDQLEAEANSDNKINCNRPSTPPSATNPQNPIAGISKKVDFVIQRITSSSSKRLRFEVWKKKLNYEGPNLIAGYGICWNVKWQSWDLKQLNDILGELYFITMRMEGDHSLACVLLSEYQYIIEFLKKRMQAPNYRNFAPMMRKMISKAKGYLDEALKCDAVILATIFNPAFQLLIFKIWFPTYHDYAQSLLQEQYNKLKSECTIREVPKVASLPSQS